MNAPYSSAAQRVNYDAGFALAQCCRAIIIQMDEIAQPIFDDRSCASDTVNRQSIL
jgi:hypothetical protein